LTVYIAQIISLLKQVIFLALTAVFNSTDKGPTFRGPPGQGVGTDLEPDDDCSQVDDDDCSQDDDNWSQVDDDNCSQDDDNCSQGATEAASASSTAGSVASSPSFSGAGAESPPSGLATGTAPSGPYASRSETSFCFSANIVLRVFS